MANERGPRNDTDVAREIISGRVFARGHDLPFFKGPATKALYGIGIEYHDISYISWAYNQDFPNTGSG
ncbi:MAG TPA: hypothetical protein VKE98_11795, partial [Gemmataceae bacterium]|nr:hypothetical protein [Gemmataceae bacterium]